MMCFLYDYDLVLLRSESFFWRTNEYVIRAFHMKESYVASTCLSNLCLWDTCAL